MLKVLNRIPSNRVSFARFLMEPTRSTTLGFSRGQSNVTNILQNLFQSIYLKILLIVTSHLQVIQENIINRYFTFTSHDSNPPVYTCTFYFKLLFICPFSVFTRKKVRHFAKRHCNGIDIKLVFSSFEISNMFGLV